MKANGSTSMSSYLTCNMVSAHAGAVDDDGPPQPQTATCCTALHRGPASTQPRFAPIRTPASAARMLDDDDDDHTIEEEETEGDGRQQQQQQKKMTKTPTRKAAEATKTMIKKMVRKCKSSVADVDASRIAADTGTPARLRRSGAVRRDWSFEDLHGGGNNAA
jgi:hypothetical protein